MVPVVSIVGRSGSGKTTLLEKVVAELTKRGYRVGTIKHDVHGFDIDRKGKDSWRHKRAGAVAVCLSSPGKFAVIKDVEGEWEPERLISSFLSDVDVVVTEGYKAGKFQKIEVVRKALSSEPVCKEDALLLAFASDARIKTGKPVYRIDDFSGVSDLIEEKVIKSHKPPAVSLVADGRTVALKPFIENLLRDGVSGMVRSLKGCARAKEIEIKVRKR